MAIEAPFHVECFGLPGEWHLVDRPVAGGAANAFVDVDAVIEEDEVGQVVHAGPAKRFIANKAVAHGRKHRGIGPELGMAGHARFGGGQAGEGGVFDGGVAVAAVNPQARSVVLVTERDRLLPRLIDTGRVR